MKEQFLENFKETLEVEDRELSLSDNFRDYEEWDSLANLSAIAMLDDEYDVVIDAEEFKEIKTLEELWKVIESRSSKVG